MLHQTTFSHIFSITFLITESPIWGGQGSGITAQELQTNFHCTTLTLQYVIELHQKMATLLKLFYIYFLELLIAATNLPTP